MAAASDRFRGQPINVLLPKRERSGRSEPSCWVKMRKHFLLVCQMWRACPAAQERGYSTSVLV